MKGTAYFGELLGRQGATVTIGSEDPVATGAKRMWENRTDCMAAVGAAGTQFGPNVVAAFVRSEQAFQHTTSAYKDMGLAA
ncbi:MAG: hypothetical protein ACYS8X_11360 [Planctomycetota bacterium]